jgi:hypothetical protein
LVIIAQAMRAILLAAAYRLRIAIRDANDRGLLLGQYVAQIRREVL